MSVRRDVGASVVWGSDMAQKGDFRGGVFISYRRVPSAADAKMLSEILESRLTRRRVFFDERIPKGADFPDEIEAALKRAHLVLIVIAPEWANDIHAREQNPSVDWVRREVAITQARRSAADPPEVRVVLVGGALMPAEHELPEDLRWLASINAYSAPRDWHSEQTWIDEFLAEIVAMIPYETSDFDESCVGRLARECAQDVITRLRNLTGLLRVLGELEEEWDREFASPEGMDPVKGLNRLKTVLTSINSEDKSALIKLTLSQRRALQQDCVAIVAEMLRLGACKLVMNLPVIGNHTTPASTKWMVTQVFAVAYRQNGRKARLVCEAGILNQPNYVSVDRALDQGTVTAGILEDQSSSILDQLWRLVPEFKGIQPSYSLNPKTPEVIGVLAEAVNSMSREVDSARVTIALQNDSSDSAGAHILRRWLVRMGLEVDVLVRTGQGGTKELSTEELNLVAPCWRCLKQIEGLTND